ncbi:MAG: type VI secretion system tube protein Hcp [Gemmatimonadota bacterium]|nr:type VI secretion system tube protein Hcp [Gemmatimonadota bacterium]
MATTGSNHFDAFLKLDGIKGESTTKGQEGAIDVQSFGWGVANIHSVAAGSGGGAGKASFSDFNFTKFADLASTALFFACASGQHIKDATLTVRKSGGEALTYLVIKMSDVLISSYQSSGSEGTDSIKPLDQCSIGFSKIQMDYTGQDAQGKAGKTVTHGWDVKANTKV